MSPHRSTKRLGEFLMERGLLSPAQLERALEHQRLTKKFLGEVLLELRMVSPQHLLSTLSKQFGIPHESLSPERVDWTFVDQLPPSALSLEHGFPIRADAESVTVAIVNPLDAWTLSQMGQLARFQNVTPVLVLPEELANIQQAYRQRVMQRMTQHLQADDHV